VNVSKSGQAKIKISKRREKESGEGGKGFENLMPEQKELQKQKKEEETERLHHDWAIRKEPRTFSGKLLGNETRK